MKVSKFKTLLFFLGTVLIFLGVALGAIGIVVHGATQWSQILELGNIRIGGFGALVALLGFTLVLIGLIAPFPTMNILTLPCNSNDGDNESAMITVKSLLLGVVLATADRGSLVDPVLKLESGSLNRHDAAAGV